MVAADTASRSASAAVTVAAREVLTAALVASRLPYPFLVSMQGLLEWYAQYNMDHVAQARLDAFLERVKRGMRHW